MLKDIFCLEMPCSCILYWRILLSHVHFVLLWKQRNSCTCAHPLFKVNNSCLVCFEL